MNISMVNQNSDSLLQSKNELAVSPLPATNAGDLVNRLKSAVPKTDLDTVPQEVFFKKRYSQVP